MTDAWSPTTDLGPTRPELAGDLGMVATTHWLASQAGMAVLERGGNAADAAVAAGFVLQVVEPHLNGPGGDLPLLVGEPGGDVHVVCGQGPAPAGATPEVLADLGLDAVPGTGLLAATVPGAFGAWTLLLERWGTWELADVLAPALGLARDGAPVLPRVAATVERMADHFRASWPTSAQVWLADGVPAAWGRLRLPGVAGTYERVLAEAVGATREQRIRAARDAWYRGFVAEEVGRFVTTTAWRDTSGREHAGLLTADDLAGWQPSVEEPVGVVHGAGEVRQCGPWSPGPVLLQQLRLLEARGVGGAPDADDDGAAVHALVEAQKLAFADRVAWYGDPAATDVPLDALLSPDYAAARAALVDPERASSELRPGRPDGREPAMPALAEYDAEGRARGGAAAAALDPVDDTPVQRAAGTGEPTFRGDTCHVDVVDASGLMVSATPSGAWLQSSPVVPALGFPLGTRAQMFRLEPGLPSTLRPGTRPRTTLSPTLLRREGRPWVALGTPGGDQQDQWSLLLVLRLVAAARRGGPLDLQAMIDAPALHSEHMPSSFYPREAAPNRVVVEGRWPAAGLEGLRRRGHDVVVGGGWTLGRLSAVARDRDWLRAGANARGAQGYAVGR